MKDLKFFQNKYIPDLPKYDLLFLITSSPTLTKCLVHSQLNSTFIFPSSTCQRYLLIPIPKTASPTQFFSAPLIL